MEPAFLDRLPSRFRKRWRENMVTFGFMILLFVLPTHCGPYGVAMFFTLVWCGYFAYYASRLRSAQPRPGPAASIMLGAILLLFAYPIVYGWLSLRVEAPGVFAFMAGTVVQLVFLIVYRKAVFPTLFGAERRSLVGEFAAIRIAQRQVRAEMREKLEKIKSDHRGG